MDEGMWCALLRGCVDSEWTWTDSILMVVSLRCVSRIGKETEMVVRRHVCMLLMFLVFF